MLSCQDIGMYLPSSSLQRVYLLLDVESATKCLRFAGGFRVRWLLSYNEGTKKRKEERQRKIYSLGKKSYVIGIYVCALIICPLWKQSSRYWNVRSTDLSFWIVARTIFIVLSSVSLLSRNFSLFFFLFFLNYQRTYLATT